MKIIKIIKGFVTNSSSANYWLNDGMLEPGEELPSEQQRVDKGQIEYYEQKEKDYGTMEIESKKKMNETVSDLILWAMFSVILIIIFLIKKLRKNDST